VDGYEALSRRGGERLLGMGASGVGLHGEGERVRGVRSKGGRPPGIHRKGGPPEAAVEGLAMSPLGDGESPATGVSGVRQRLVTSPSRQAVARKRGSTSARNPQATPDNIDPKRWLREPDTFRALHDSGLLRRALREHGWEASRVEEAVRRTMPRLRRLRPASSATCSDDESLAAFLRKHYLWGCRTYDPAKAKASARLRARMADQARIAPSLRLDDGALSIYLKGVAGLSEDELRSFRRFRSLERRHAGRIACRTLYTAFGGQRRFTGFQAGHHLLSIAQEHSQSVGRCRQWTLAPRVVRSVRRLMASPTLLFMLRGGGRGERGVIYSETQRRNPQRRRRIPTVHPARVAGHALESVAVTLPARGPPPAATKTLENAMFGIPDSATGTRRHRERATAA